LKFQKLGDYSRKKRPAARYQFMYMRNHVISIRMRNLCFVHLYFVVRIPFWDLQLHSVQGVFSSYTDFKSWHLLTLTRTLSLGRVTQRITLIALVRQISILHPRISHGQSSPFDAPIWHLRPDPRRKHYNSTASRGATS
jgi:hypothetical protein